MFGTMVERLMNPGSLEQDRSVVDTGPPGNTGRPLRWLPILIVALAAVALFVNTMPNGLVVDDLRQIRNNPLIRDVRHLPAILTTGVWEFEGRASSYYRPLMHILYMVVYLTLGPGPFGFHLLNLLVHAGCSVLVFLLLGALLPQVDGRAGRLHRSAPLLGALLFAAHPIHTEPVAWAAGIVDITLTFFCLLSLYFYVRRKEMSPRAGLALSLAAFFFATLCKEPAVTLPLAIVAYDLLFGGREGRNLAAAGRWLLFALVAGVYFVLRTNALHGFAPITTDTHLSLSDYLLSVPALFSLYLGKLVLPIELNFFHHFQPPDGLLSGAGLLALTAASAFLVIAWFTWKRNRIAFFGLLLIVLPLLPAFYLPALNQGLQNALTERYLYLPSFGAILWLAAILHRGRSTRAAWEPVLAVAMLAAIVACSAATVRRNLVWRNAFTLWSDTVAKSPASGVAHMGYGLALLREGRRAEGEAELRTASRLDPSLVEVSLDQGLHYGRRGMLKDALISFQTALALSPDSVRAHYAVAVAYDDRGWYDQAIRHYEKALALEPGLAQAHNNLGVLYAKSGRLDDALPHFEAAVRLQPDNGSFRTNLQRARRDRGPADGSSTAEEPAAPKDAR